LKTIETFLQALIVKIIALENLQNIPNLRKLSDLACKYLCINLHGFLKKKVYLNLLKLGHVSAGDILKVCLKVLTFVTKIDERFFSNSTLVRFFLPS